MCRSDGVKQLSAVHQRVLRLERVGETSELLEPRIGVMLAVLGMTGNLDGNDVLVGTKPLGSPPSAPSGIMCVIVDLVRPSAHNA